MKKGLEIVKIISITLFVILLTILAFLGLYVKENNIWKNVIPEFNFGMELDGVRELRYVLDTTEEEKTVYIDSEGNILGEVKEEEIPVETDGVSLETVEESNKEKAEENTEETKEEVVQENNVPNYATEVRKIKANEDSAKTIQNYEKSKKIIQKRLEEQDAYEYNIRLDSVTGELILELPNDEDIIQKTKAAVSTKGVFKIIDEQTGIILIDKKDIKSFGTGIYENSGYQVCLQINLNKEGAEKLRKISNEYRQVVNEAGQTTTNYVSVMIDGQALLTTYFGEELSQGILQIPLGNSTTNTSELNLISEEATRLANILNGQEMPIVYTLSSDIFMKSTITDKNMVTAKIILLAILLIVSFISVIKFKRNGIIASILSIGYVSLLMLFLKYFASDVSITINSLVAFLAMIVLNYVFMKKLLIELKQNKNRKEAISKVFKNYYLIILPICVIAIIFTLISSTVINSIGMVLFWGLLLQFLYNVFTIRSLELI